MNLMQMSFSGAVMILAVFVIRAGLIHRLPKKLFILLWEAALLRLLLPFSVPSPLSVYTLACGRLSGGNAAKPLSPALYLIPQTTVVQTDADAVGAQILQSGIPEGAAHGEVSVYFLIWLLGALACAAFFAVSYLRCYREFRTSLPLHSEAAAGWLKKHPLRREVRLRQSDRVSTPLTYGILRPVILLPTGMDWENEKQMEYILLHEHIHIRHFDAVKKMVMVSALCVHWFNPFVWMMYLLFNRDMELACDEGVVRHSGAQSRRAYADTLIRMEEKRSMALPFCNNFSQNAVRERIRAIMKTKKITIGIIVLCAVIFAAVMILFATSADSRRQAKEPFETTAVGTDEMDARESRTPADGENLADSAVGPENQNENMEKTGEEEPPQAEGREEWTVLQYMIEGSLEETPATLYAGEGFSLYIPDEDWQIYDENPVEPEKMSAVYLPSEGQIGLWVEYYEAGAADTQSAFLSEGYAPAEEEGRLQRQDGDVLTEVRIFGTENASWTVCSRRPATAEGTEGAAVRLEAIAETFALTAGKQENTGQSGITEQADDIQDAERTAIRELATAFYTAYFSGNTEEIRNYLSAAFDGTPDVYDALDTADDIVIHKIKIPDKTEDMADERSVSVEFTVPGEDSYTYLSIQMVKESGEWKISFYGLEK